MLKSEPVITPHTHHQVDSMTTKPTQPKPTPIRMPEPLKTWLRHQAVDNRRSLSGEIVYRLEQSRQEQEKERS